MANATLGGYGADASETDSVDPSKFVHIIGAAISLGVLLVLLGWGANTLMRDASGIPVVEALDGPIRVSPDEPGGIPASHQGLSVNSVAANLSQPAISDDLRLAPQPVALTAEDQPTIVLQAQSPQARPQALVSATAPLQAAAPAIPTQPDGIDAFAAELASLAQPLSDLPQSTVAAPQVVTSLSGSALPTQDVPSTASINQTGVIAQTTVRPQLRPAALVVADPGVATSPFDAVVPAGTQLAQLGAFDSRAIAEREWARLSQKFASYLGGKSPLIQTTTTNGSTLHRLRVSGFAAAADARRFCGALSDQGGACYPVVMR